MVKIKLKVKMKVVSWIEENKDEKEDAWRMYKCNGCG